MKSLDRFDIFIFGGGATSVKYGLSSMKQHTDS